MGFVADILLAAAALGAMLYCAVLSRRLNRFNDLERGVGGAIATLSSQVQDMTRTVRSAKGAAAESAETLGDLTQRAESAARRLELLVASLHDLPDNAPPKPHGNDGAGVTPVPTAPEPGHAETPPPTKAASPDPAPEPVFSSRRAVPGAAE